ncbi:uncharacterized protein KY384_006885 [Bacidia gigantensis]|uniref:uncharacterized protein n=1 Tax=Bacidia gigantensis TaxID=2732470 RepID=UPI001D04F19B|nr:uncharacterized protein KY384_006885 [Bacidia gigantensis]KAG8527969.1 hypothetical protein KY384_006885 [Bacidia gigantensis]
MKPLSAAQNFRQHQRITTTLRQICEAYPPNTCLRELLQNADDAGATEVEYVLDTKSYPERPLLHEELADYCGPALLVRNDSVFKDEDFQSLSTIGDSVKRFDPATTGRFGQDGPWVYSRNLLLLLDPHERWSKSFEAGAGGPAFDVVGNHAVPEIQNMMKHFAVFDVRPSQERPDTIIRIPLRTSLQAKNSEIVRHSVSVANVTEILKQFSKDIQQGGLLFLKNIRKVVIKVNKKVISSAEIPTGTSDAE